jgi:Transglutaminase-like superfamily
MPRPIWPSDAMPAARAALRRLVHVPLRDWPDVLTTLATAVVIEVGLRSMRLPALARLVHVPLGEEPPAASRTADALQLPPDAVRRLRTSAAIMRHWPFDEKCLRRSLVCGRAIRKLHPRLILGVVVVDNEVKAHAWLSIDGVSLDPWGSASYLGLLPVRRP